MKNQPLRTFGVAAVVAQCLVLFACSSATTPSGGTGGSSGVGGASGDASGNLYGSCDGVTENPDIGTGQACTADCASVSCTTAGPKCHADCCVSCGLDALGAKMCQCPNIGFAYTNCTCAPPANFPTLLHGGPCEPQGDSRAAPPAGSISLKGVACTKTNVVCFTSDSIATSERGCICMADGVLHCGSVNHWFTNDAVTTTYN